jgi:hypothetical protein
MTRGNVEPALAAGPHRLSGELRCGGQDHFYLEGQIALAVPDEGGDMHVWSSTQHPTEVQHGVAHLLALPFNAVIEVFAAAEGLELRFIERDAKTPAAARASEPVRKVGPHTILVADDDPTIVRLLTLTLEQDGFRIVTASDGEAALRLARLEHPDLILLDWQMPNADGMEVTRRLRHESDPVLRDVPRRANHGTIRAREHGGGICRRRDRLSDQALPARAC